ncbi:MAG: M48 family metalloprotease [Myxococcota bacterium]
MPVAVTTIRSTRDLSECAPRLGLGVVVVCLASFFLSFTALCCAINPVTGRREVILMSEDKEKEIDAEAAKQVAEQIGLVEAPELHAYVTAIGEKMASYSPRKGIEYSFNVVEMAEPNAFALPGGHIYVSRGLLVAVNSEAELANVIGHEIGHVAARHAAQRDARAKTVGLLTLLGVVAAAASGATDVAVGLGQFGGLAGAGLIAAYGRDQEREADQIGQDLAAQAGVDPAGMADFLRTLDKLTRLHSGASRLPSFFDNHPSTPERVAETATRAQVLRWTPAFAIAGTRAAYLKRLEGIAVEEPAAEGVIRDDRFLHAALDFSLRFPHGWTVENQHARVIAVSPRRDALVLLELQGEGEDPQVAAQAYAEENKFRLLSGSPIRIGNLAAFRARTLIQSPGGPTAAEVTWVAHGGRIFRLSGGTVRIRFQKYEGVFRSFARSFRPLQAGELEKIDELRLRVAVAREGEGLAELSRRTGNEWGLNQTAVMNGLVSSDTLREGQLVKIALRERYRPAPEAGADPPRDQ